MPDCPICGKPYKSRSGLATHRKTHDATPDQLPLAALPGPAVRVPPHIEDELVAAYKADLAAQACDDLGIHPDNVMSFKVYDDDHVVIIEGPVGFKRTWTRGHQP